MFQHTNKYILIGILLALFLPGSAQAWTCDGDTYDYRSPIENTTDLATGVQISVNGTAGINGAIYWIQTDGQQLYVYCSVSGCGSGDITIGNDTCEISVPFEIEGGVPVPSLWTGSHTYHLNESASVIDDAEGTYDLTRQGNPTTNTSGVFGSGVEFDGDTDCFETAAQNFNFATGNNEHTMVVWANSREMPQTETYARQANFGVNTINQGPMISHYAATDHWGGGTWGDNLDSGVDMTPNQWFFLAQQHYSNSTTNLIIDKVQTNTKSITLNVQAASYMNIGARIGLCTANEFKGTMDEIRIYNRTLTKTELDFLADNGNDIAFKTGTEEAISTDTLEITMTPAVIYTNTMVTCSIYYNATGTADIDARVLINSTEFNSSSWNSVAAESTVNITMNHSFFYKHGNISCYANATYGAGTMSDEVNRTVSNSLPTTPSIIFNLSSVIIGDNFNYTGSSTDPDGDSLTYWFKQGYSNGTNISDWTTDNDLLVNASQETDTFRIYCQADDGDDNSTINSSDMIVTNFDILYPVDLTEYTGDTFNFTNNFTVQNSQPCYSMVDSTQYTLGSLTTGVWNNSRYVFYGNHTYNVTCYSLQDSSRNYTKIINFSNVFSIWNISIMTENEWDTPLNISGANLSIIISCEGGSSYVYNFTGSVITDVKPLCDVSTITALVNYETDSYQRERVPPSCTNCDVPMYMVDALVYTVLQIPIYMSDYNYYDALIELYKSQGENHYTIAQGYFDVEHKYVTYLTKDNSYFIRLTQNNEVRDIGYLYAATATAQYLSLSSIQLTPTITLISDNILMSAELDNVTAPTTTLRIQYFDMLNATESVRVRVFQNINNTAFYDNTFSDISNLTISINDINTSFRYSVTFEIEHSILGNSPVKFTMGVGSGSTLADLGLPASMNWLYMGFAFFIVLMTSFALVPENRLPGYLLLIAELGILSYFQWFTFDAVQLAYFVVFPVAGLIYEIKQGRGVS